MSVPFAPFSPEDPVWLFPLVHPLDDSTETQLLDTIRAFLPQWKTHGRTVRGEVTSLERRVVVVAGHVAGGISGCGQDALRHAVEAACMSLKTDLASPLSTWVCNAENTWALLSRSELKKAFRTGEYGGHTMLIDGTIRSVGAYRAGGVVPVSTSWAKDFLPAPTPVS